MAGCEADALLLLPGRDGSVTAGCEADALPLLPGRGRSVTAAARRGAGGRPACALGSPRDSPCVSSRAGSGPAAASSSGGGGGAAALPSPASSHPC